MAQVYDLEMCTTALLY